MKTWWIKIAICWYGLVLEKLESVSKKTLMIWLRITFVSKLNFWTLHIMHHKLIQSNLCIWVINTILCKRFCLYNSWISVYYLQYLLSWSIWDDWRLNQINFQKKIWLLWFKWYKKAIWFRQWFRVKQKGLFYWMKHRSNAISLGERSFSFWRKVPIKIQKNEKRIRKFIAHNV